MPITLLPPTRRDFLAASAAAGIGLLARPTLSATVGPLPDPNRFALLSDVHIAAKKVTQIHGAVMAEHLRTAIEQILHQDRPPACAIINGDCAFLTGISEDYLTLIELLEPLRRAGIPLHMAMGNHDVRENFWKALAPVENRVKQLADRQVLCVKTPHANFLILDSLEKTNEDPGSLGDSQLKWLAQSLDAQPKTPAIVLVHHDPQELPSAINAESHSLMIVKKITGLNDTRALFDVLLPRRQAKALIFGHTHVWSIEQRDGLHLINLPAVSFVFDPKQPSGWVDARVSEKGISLELRCLAAHAMNGEKHELAWRK